MPTDKREKIQKVIDTLTMGRRSEKTIENYVCAINWIVNPFLNNFYKDTFLYSIGVK